MCRDLGATTDEASKSRQRQLPGFSALWHSAQLCNAKQAIIRLIVVAEVMPCTCERTFTPRATGVLRNDMPDRTAQDSAAPTVGGVKSRFFRRTVKLDCGNASSTLASAAPSSCEREPLAVAIGVTSASSRDGVRPVFLNIFWNMLLRVHVCHIDRRALAKPRLPT